MTVPQNEWREAVNGKLKWTRHHFDILNKAVADYTDPENTRFFATRYNEAKTEAWGHFDSVSGPPTHISHVFGDVLQSANSCLDYLVCELFRRYNPGESAKPSHKFPIVETRGAFNKEIGSDALYGVPFEAIAVIDGLQPYEGRTDAVHSDLLTLRRLANEHKHRKIHVSVLAANPAPGDVAPIERDGEVFVMAQDLPKAMHFKAEIGPFPITPKGEVEMDRKFAAVVVLEERGFREIPINLLAENLCMAVTESINRFIRFFA